MLTRIVRLPTVTNRTGLSRSTLYLYMSQGKFPKPVSLGSRAVGWVESEIEEWLGQRIDASRGRGSSNIGSVGILTDPEGLTKSWSEMDERLGHRIDASRGRGSSDTGSVDISTDPEELTKS